MNGSTPIWGSTITVCRTKDENKVGALYIRDLQFKQWLLQKTPHPATGFYKVQFLQEHFFFPKKEDHLLSFAWSCLLTVTRGRQLTKHATWHKYPAVYLSAVLKKKYTGWFGFLLKYIVYFIFFIILYYSILMIPYIDINDTYKILILYNVVIIQFIYFLVLRTCLSKKKKRQHLTST